MTRPGDPPAPPLAPGSPGPARLALTAAVLQLAVSLLAYGSASIGVCPAAGSGLSCATLIRPRFGDLPGPVDVPLLALIGALFAVGLAGALLFGRPPAPFARGGAAVLAAGAGLALGLQALPLAARAGVCPVCLGVAALAALTAALVGAVAVRAHGARPALLALACAGLLAPSAGLGAWRGGALAADDAARRAQVAEAGGPAGPRLLLVRREGCPYCEALLLDGLGEPAALERLARTRGLEQVPADSQEGRRLAPSGATPLLVALDGEGRVLLRLEGLRPPGEVVRWLDRALEASPRR